MRERATRRRDLDDPRARHRRRVVLARWRRRWGDLCPGFERKPHLAGGRYNPLTVDHLVPVVAGGTDDWDNLVVLCRECNGRKGG